MKDDYATKIRSMHGLCTNVCKDDRINADRMAYILRMYLAGHELQYSNRNSDSWNLCDSLPMNFEDYRYRIM
jgi:hypothetical protein